MRKVFENATEKLRTFVGQRNDLALVVRVSEADSALFFKLFDTVEEGSSTEFFWVMSDPFVDARSYASTVIASFAARHSLFRTVQESENLPQWPPIPADIMNESAPPAQRLQRAMMFARSLLPAENGFVTVWIMFPTQIQDHAAHAALMSEVLKHEFPFPWCHHIRVILRDDPSSQFIKNSLARSPRIASYEPDFSPKAFEQALNDEADDEEQPLEQQLQAVLMTAAMDFSHKRYPAALDKYQLLLRYYSAKGMHAMSALVLNSIGDVFMALGKRDQAGEVWEAAIVPASEGNPAPLPILNNIVWNLANLRAGDRDWKQAEAYFNEAQKLASVQRNPPFKIIAIERLGNAQYEQGKTDAALATWDVGVSLAQQFELPHEGKLPLERQRAHYQKVRDRAKLHEVETKFAAFEALAAKLATPAAP